MTQNQQEQNLNQKFTGFKYRKLIHYSLVISIILLQVFLLTLLYNKFYNEPKLEKLQADLHLSDEVNKFNNLTRYSYLEAQSNLQQYIITKDVVYLEKYNKSLIDLNNNLKKLDQFANNNDLLSLYLRKSNADLTSIKKIGLRIDSISKLKSPMEMEWKDYILKNKKFEYNNILDSISVEKNVSVDSVKKKGLFGRVSDAISNKVDVQREKENVVLTLEKKNQKNKENLEKQFEELFAKVNKYYQKEFSKFKQHYIQKRTSTNEESSSFLAANKELLSYSNTLLESYNKALVSFTNDTRANFEEQYKTNENYKNIVVIGLLFLIVIISILLVLLTKMAFDYEERLKSAKEIIKNNLSFKNRIVGMISHEIRAPLNIISIYSKGIRSQVQDQEIQESLKSIEFTTNSLSLLSNQILEFSKNENSKMTLKPKVFSLQNELNGIFKSLQSLVTTNENQLVINNKIDKGITNVNSDATKIHQLFYNLVGNANKFTNNGCITIDLETEYLADNIIDLKVKIKDNGAGISEEDLQHIFEEYHQGTLSDQVKNLGVGLGLNLCREIVELYNGTIAVTSKQGVETVVTFNLQLPKQQ